MALELGSIGSERFVWRRGWKQWLQAERVQRFARVLGDRARSSLEPIIDLKQETPPPVPDLSGFAVAPKRNSTPIPPPHHKRALVRRPPVPTIAEGAMPAGGDTLRPPGAVPPPPRGTPRFALGELEDRDANPVERLERRDPTATGLTYVGASHRPSAGVLRHAPSAAGLVVPGRSASLTHEAANGESIQELPKEELSSPQHAVTDLPTILYDPDALDARPSTPGLRARAWSKIGWARRYRIWSAVVLVLGVASLALGFWLTLRPAVKPVVKSPTAPRPSVAPPKTAACTVSRSAQRISSSVLISVPPIAADVAVDGRMWLGFAENPTTAAGISVDPADLDISLPFRETGEQRIISVVPLVEAGSATFRTLRENPSIRQGRAVAASPDFLFGIAESGLVRQPIGGGIETIWAVDPKTNLTDPRISSLAGQGHAVTFRQGGQTGALMLGWLTEAGRARSGLFQIKSPVAYVGNPAAAMSGDTALIAYAGRASETDAWSIFLSLAEIGKPPQPSTPFEQPTGGTGGDSISPSVVALTRQRWLLQWSEGSQGQRQVRIQTLDRDGHPLDIAHTVSPVGSNSGQGLLWSTGQRAVSLFVVSIGRSAELWATPIHCPE